MNEIRRLRELNNMTQDELAKKLGVGRSTVAKWESGENMPRVKQLIAMSQFFGVKVDVLLCH